MGRGFGGKDIRLEQQETVRQERRGILSRLPFRPSDDGDGAAAGQWDDRSVAFAVTGVLGAAAVAIGVSGGLALALARLGSREDEQ